jgi:5-methylcytosine-specific restriction endonuclease McrBC regulatory subunit McrC
VYQAERQTRYLKARADASGTTRSAVLRNIIDDAVRLFKPQQDKPFDFREDEALPEVLALAAAARRAFTHGLLHGYRVEEDRLQTVRGRIRIGDQIRQRPGFMLPIEVRYDEFTEDILENRLVKAATARLARMRLRSPDARAELSWVVGMLEQVALVEFSASDLPETRFTRLNEHYRECWRWPISFCATAPSHRPGVPYGRRASW